MNEKSKFNQFLCDWIRSDDGTYVLSPELFPTRELAIEKLHEEFDSWPGKYDLNFKLGDLNSDRVRFSCQGDGYDGPRCAWWLGSSGKGFKASMDIPASTETYKDLPGVFDFSLFEVGGTTGRSWWCTAVRDYPGQPFPRSPHGSSYSVQGSPRPASDPLHQS